MSADLAKALDEIGRLDAERHYGNKSAPWENQHFTTDQCERNWAIAVLNAAPLMLKALAEYRAHLCPAPAASLRDGMAMGATGWWLLEKQDGDNKWHSYAHMTENDAPPFKDIRGFTYNPAELLAWVRDGKLPGEAGK